MNALQEIKRWIQDAGQEPGPGSMLLYSALCAEETGEMLHCWKRHTMARDLRWESEAMRMHGGGNPDQPDLLDAACDLIWVATGLIVAMGIDPDEAMRRVIDSNNSKRQPDGTFLKDATGKIQKPLGYQPPSWEGLL